MNVQVSRFRSQALVFLPLIPSVVVCQLQSQFEVEPDDMSSPLSCSCKKAHPTPSATTMARTHRLTPTPTPVLAPELNPPAEAVDVCEAEAIINDAEILEIESAELVLVGGVVDTGALPVVVVGATDDVSLSVMLMYWLANPFEDFKEESLACAELKFWVSTCPTEVNNPDEGGGIRKSS
jgi:hypothetical protein